MTRKRAHLRQLFVTGEKRLQVHFHTSSLEKYLHASEVFGKSGLKLYHFKSNVDPYDEDYSKPKKELITSAIAEIRNRVGADSIFFVEDTSLRIEALSTADSDVPGLQVKEWFSNSSFDELDSELKKKGNRDCIVKSDIGLHLPNLKRPIFFHGESTGKVACEPPSFAANKVYPWLTSETFNGWFVPDGGNRPIGQMDLEESWRFDFRTAALEKLLDRLEEFTSILNLSSNVYSTRKKSTSTPTQRNLFGEDQKVFVVVGKVCAGKTTFGQRAEKLHQYTWVEASSVLKSLRNEYDPDQPQGSKFAEKILGEMGQDVVAAKILDMYGTHFERGMVITGFRTIEELETFRSKVPDVKVVLIDAPERDRFRRHLGRDRIRDIDTISKFRNHDKEQWRFGLLRVAEEFADMKISNEKPLEDYYDQIDAILENKPRKVTGVSLDLAPKLKGDNRVYRCLRILEDAGRPLNCDEIEQLTAANNGKRITHNNVNKVLKKVPELARRFEVDFEKIRYQISEPGRAYLRLFQAMLNG